MKHSLCVLLLTLVTMAGTTGTSLAQTFGRGIEVGAQVSTLKSRDSVPTNTGVGGRVAWHLTDWVAAEAEVNYFAIDQFEWERRFMTSPTIPVFDVALRYNRSRVEAFFGSKIGYRARRFGVFAKARPGFTRLTDKGVRCVGESCPLVQFLIVRPEYRTEFAVDLGGVFEFYPTVRTVARVDVGSRMIRHRSSAPPCSDCTRQNLTTSLGLGFRF